jgi:ferredoxin-NADP reductase
MSQSNQAKQKNLLLSCSAIIDETLDVKTFELVSQSDEMIVFKPGQFVTLKFNILDQSYQRCYTISSSPRQNNCIELCVKRVAEGVVSNWLLDHLKLGDTIEAVPPSGNFYLPSEQTRSLLLLSAGSGITPMLSMLRYIQLNCLEIDIKFHHSARTQADLIAFTELSALSKKQLALQLSFNFSRQKHCSIDRVKTFDGRLDRQMLSEICPDITQRDVYICGPSGFMLQAKQDMQQLGLPKEQYFQESFAVESLLVTGTADESLYNIYFSHSDLSIQCTGNETVLAAAEKSGIYLDFSCSSGICGSCTSYLETGEIYAPEAQAIDAGDIKSGDFLPCCSFARSDLIVDL